MSDTVEEAAHAQHDHVIIDKARLAAAVRRKGEQRTDQDGPPAR